MKFMEVFIVFAIVLGRSFNKRVDIWLVQIAFSFVLVTVARSPSTSIVKMDHRMEYISGVQTFITST